MMGKAFASPRRLELLDLLAQAPRSVEELARGERPVDGQRLPAPAGAPRGRDGHPHPRRHARPLRDRRRGGAARSGSPCATPRRRAWPRSSAPLTTTSARTSRRSVARSCSSRLRAGDVVLVDVRPPEEFAAGHIEGARSIPIAELEQRLAELPADREVVAYCRGPFCAYAHEAVRRLQRGRPQGQPARGGLARMALT